LPTARSSRARSASISTPSASSTGQKSARSEAIKQALDKGGIPTVLSDNIIGGMWLKFAGFVSIAVIASLTRSRAGNIARAAAGSAFVAAVIDEC